MPMSLHQVAVLAMLVALLLGHSAARVATNHPNMETPRPESSQHAGQRYDRDGMHPIHWELPNPGSSNGRSLDFADYATGQEADWVQMGQDAVNAAITGQLPDYRPAKNLILFIGDGMGPPTVTAARWLLQKREALHASDAALTWETFPSVGLAKTYNTDYMTPDSAGTATALQCGEKTRMGTIGVNQHVERGNCQAVDENKIFSIITKGMEAGMMGGVVTTARVTHATPAAAYAHSAERNWECDADIPDSVKTTCPDVKDIAYQLVHESHENLRVVFGGGREKFFPNTEQDPEHPDIYGSREDGRNLIEDWKQKQEDLNLTYVFMKDEEDMKAFSEDYDTYLGLFNPSHMNFTESTPEALQLRNLVTKAISILKRSPTGFILMAEGGRIDHAHHFNNAYRALSETISLHQAVGDSISALPEDDTLVVLTADHSHAFMQAGYQHINDDILGMIKDYPSEDVLVADDDKPYTSLSYQTGPAWYNHRNGERRIDLRDLAPEEQPSTDNQDYLQDAYLPFPFGNHGGEDIGVYAYGPSSFLFNGVYEQNYIAQAMSFVGCLDHRDEEECPDHPIVEFPCA